MSRLARVLCAAAAACLLAAAPAYAEVHHVHEGDSIQAALDAAQPGDTVLVHRGTYSESLLITKDRIRLRGKRALLLEPNSPGNTPCNEPGAVTGICVFGDVNPATGDVDDYVTGVRIRGFTIQDFSGNGILAAGSERLRVSRVKLIRDGEYGAFALFSKSPRFVHNLATDNDEAGFYVGDSLEANAVVRHNRSFDNGNGVFLRDAVGGRVSHNKLAGNCAGVLVLADSPGPAGNFRIDHNKVARNNSDECPGDPAAGEPPSRARHRARGRLRDARLAQPRLRQPAIGQLVRIRRNRRHEDPGRHRPAERRRPPQQGIRQ